MAWTEEEKRQYAEIRSKELGPVYALAGIPVNDPKARAEYLCEKILKLSMIDHEAFMGIAAKEGKPAALKLLETMALEEFF